MARLALHGSAKLLVLRWGSKKASIMFLESMHGAWLGSEKQQSQAPTVVVGAGPAVWCR